MPRAPFSKFIYVDENALQPGQTDVAWGWDDVQYADSASEALEAFTRLGDEHGRLAYLASELASWGLEVHTQPYTIDIGTGVRVNGTNVYARSYTPRIDGREAMVLAASWHSRLKQTVNPGKGLPYAPPALGGRAANIRGTALVLALARCLSSTPHWSKDLLFVFSDGHLDGMQAWATSYFGNAPAAIHADAVHGGDAQIWNALALDFPANSYSSLSFLHEGRDGQLPNLDTMNSVMAILERMQFNPMTGLHGATYEQAAAAAEPADWEWYLPAVVRDALEPYRLLLRDYGMGWRALWTQWRLQLAGHPSGVHGVLLPYHVDAITLYAEPSAGPNGFYELGKVTESTLRSFSNLVERLHHSQFFYLLLSPWRFVPIGVYILVPLGLGAVLTLAGLAIWHALGVRRDQLRRALFDRVAPKSTAPEWEQPTYWELARRMESAPPAARAVALGAYNALARPTWPVLGCMAAAHAAGVLCLAATVSLPWLPSFGAAVWLVRALTLVFPAAMTYTVLRSELEIVQFATCLHAFTLLEAGMVASVLSTLNMAQALFIALVGIATLYTMNPPWGMHVDHGMRRGWAPCVKYTAHALACLALSPPFLALGAEAVEGPSVHMALWDFCVLRTAALPLAFVAYLPLLFQGAVAAGLYAVASS